jgi:hypothetical protein
MKCDICKSDETCRTVTVYYARIIEENFTNYKTKSSSTIAIHETSFSNVLNKDIRICEKCMHKFKIQMLLVVPLTIMILPIFFLIGVLGGGLAADEIAVVAYVIFLGPFLISVVITTNLLIKKSYTKIKKVDIYNVGLTILKKQHKRIDPNGKNCYWNSYPDNLHQIEY